MGYPYSRTFTLDTSAPPTPYADPPAGVVVLSLEQILATPPDFMQERIEVMADAMEDGYSERFVRGDDVPQVVERRGYEFL